MCVCVAGGGGHVWQGSCKQGAGAVCGRGGSVHDAGHAWKGACVEGGMCGRGGMHSVGGVCQGEWWGGGVCVAGETATETGGTLPTGICILVRNTNIASLFEPG